MVLGLDAFWVATIVFALTYLLVIADRINRSIIALLCAGLMVVSGGLSQEEAIRGVTRRHWLALLRGCCRPSRPFGVRHGSAISARAQSGLRLHPRPS